MADTKISALTNGVNAQGTDLLPIARSGANYSITPAMLSTYTLGNISAGSNITLTTTSGGITIASTGGGGGGTPGGSSGQIQYNNSGAFGGFTVGGDGTLNTGTGALTVTGSSGNAFSTTAFKLAANIGYMNIPQVGGAQITTNYTGVLNDQGQMAVMNATTLTYTIPANASVAYPVGTVLTIVNIFAGNLSIAITTDTLTLAGTTTTGTRTLAQNGTATAVKVSATSWLISGVGLS